MAHIVLRLPAVMALTGLSRSSIYHQIAEDRFPKQIRLSRRAVGWLRHDVEAWIQERVALTRECIAAAGGAAT